MNSKSINLSFCALMALALCLGIICPQLGYASEEKKTLGVVEVQERASVGVAISPIQFSIKLKDHDRQLALIEELVTRIEGAKMNEDKEKHANDLNDALAVYAKGMLESFDTAIKQTELSSNTKGKQGSVALLKSFEDLAVKHENKLKQIDARAQKIISLKSSSITGQAGSANVVYAEPIIDNIINFFFPNAQAAIALSIKSACSANPPNQTACNQAIITGATNANQARYEFNRCWAAQENVRPKAWRAVKRIDCTLALIAKLA